MVRLLSSALAFALVIGGLTGCGSGGNTALKVGDCINFANTDDGENTVVDCAQPHDQEVFHTFDMPDGDFPGYFEIGDAQQDECTSAFEEYVGLPWEESMYTFDFTGPTEQTWESGERTIVCLLEDNSGERISGSARGTAR